MTTDRTRNTAQGRNDPQPASTEARRAEARAQAQKDGRQRAADQESRMRQSDSAVDLPGNDTQGSTRGDSGGKERR